MYRIEGEKSNKRGWTHLYSVTEPADAQRLFQRARGEYPRTHRVRLRHQRPDGSWERARPQFGLREA